MSDKEYVFYSTLEEAIDAAREEFLADNPGVEEEDADVQQLNIQKYVLQDGDIMWQAEFFADEGEDGECLPILSGEGAQAVFDGDYDEIELRQASFSSNRRWIPKRVRPQRTNGTSDKSPLLVGAVAGIDGQQ